MPTYDLKNKETGEIKEYIISISKMEEMIAEDYEQVHTKVAGIISQSGSTIAKTSKDWANHLENIKKASGKGNSIHV
jgi:hypothetical protein